MRRGAGPPAINLPPATLALIAIIGLAHITRLIAPEPIETNALTVFGFIPARFTALPTDLAGWLPLFTYPLLHSGWMHLIVNLVAIAAFGAGVERMGGKFWMLVIAIGAGLVGALAHWGWAMESVAPVVGASGLASGLFGAAIVGLRRMQGDQPGADRGLLIVLGVMVAASALMGSGGAPGAPGPVAWVAHIGGFVFGAGAWFLLTRPRRSVDR